MDLHTAARYMGIVLCATANIHIPPIVGHLRPNHPCGVVRHLQHLGVLLLRGPYHMVPQLLVQVDVGLGSQIHTGSGCWVAVVKQSLYVRRSAMAPTTLQLACFLVCVALHSYCHITGVTAGATTLHLVVMGPGHGGELDVLQGLWKVSPPSRHHSADLECAPVAATAAQGVRPQATVFTERMSAQCNLWGGCINQSVMTGCVDTDETNVNTEAIQWLWRWLVLLQKLILDMINTSVYRAIAAEGVGVEKDLTLIRGVGCTENHALCLQAAVVRVVVPGCAPAKMCGEMCGYFRY